VEKLLMTVHEVAAALGLGRTKVYELIATGQLTAVRVGAAVRVPVEAVRLWVEERAAAGTVGEREPHGNRTAESGGGRS
jgi:excisionase family DNA binding protein